MMKVVKTPPGGDVGVGFIYIITLIELNIHTVYVFDCLCTYMYMIYYIIQVIQMYSNRRRNYSLIIF